MLYNRHSVQILTSIPMLFVLVFKLNVASIENVVFFRTATGSILVQLFIMPECISPKTMGEQCVSERAREKMRERKKMRQVGIRVDNDSNFILDATKIQRI